MAPSDRVAALEYGYIMEYLKGHLPPEAYRSIGEGKPESFVIDVKATEVQQAYNDAGFASPAAPAAMPLAETKLIAPLLDNRFKVPRRF